MAPKTRENERSIDIKTVGGKKGARWKVPGSPGGRGGYAIDGPDGGLIVAAMERFRLNGVTVSDAGLLEGILAGVGRNGGEGG